MSIFLIVILVLIGVNLLAMGAMVVWGWVQPEIMESSLPAPSLFLSLLALPLIILVIVLGTGLIIEKGLAIAAVVAAVIVAITGAFAFGIKAAKSSYEGRARLLIIEKLSVGPASRPEIRAAVEADNRMFRTIKATYVDALESLLSSGRVRIDQGKYELVRTP